MMYQGGKTRLASSIAPFIVQHAAPGVRYVEPFLGSAAVMAVVAGNFSVAVGADVVPDLVALWRDAIAGWVPPESLTRDEYVSLRDAEPSALRAFAGFPCSFAGKWFGGYASDPKSDRNFARTGSRSIVRRAAIMRNVDVQLTDYRNLRITSADVVYCDPPYAGTTGYARAGAFDSVEFWQIAEGWARNGATVYVSEYAAPDGWRSVWSTERHTSTARDNRGAKAIDHLFTWNGSPL